MGCDFLKFCFHKFMFLSLLVVICVALMLACNSTNRPKAESISQSLASQISKKTISSRPPAKSAQKIQVPDKVKSSEREEGSAKEKDSDKKRIPDSFLKLQNKYQLVVIPTYDGSYQLTHPKVLYFPQGWNGYQYWMSMTPYPYEHDIYENPSIIVSNDGKTWETPARLTNPVSGIPSDVATGGHYSDPQIVMRGDTMELWYRYNPALPNNSPKQASEKQLSGLQTPDKQSSQAQSHTKQSPDKRIRRRANNSINIYYRKTTKDGIHWTGAQKLRQSENGLLSMCVNYENGMYKTWYATYGGDLLYSESKDALGWSTPVYCSVPLPKGLEPYHQDMIKYGSEYYLLQTAEKMSNYTFQLFLLRSEDGINFTQMEPVFPSKNMALWQDISFYRSTLFVKDDKLNVYISLVIPHLKWYITKTTLPLSDLKS